jgi:S-DNA-T family DNA segregation ATPase FtsK/SpoIIIE
MTYSFRTPSSLNSRNGDLESPGVNRFSQEIGLFLGLIVLVFCTLALLSHSAQDPAWSTSGGEGVVHNWVGRFGAWLSDISFFMLGFSVWWCLAAGVRVWLASLAIWMRGEESARPLKSRLDRFRAGWLAFWLGLLLLLLSSTSLEWSRLYRLESHLPGHGGGVLGYLAGSAGVKWLGFTGSALLGIILGVVGVSLVFRFSWGRLAERIGACLETLVTSLRAKRERAEDLELGKQAARERGEDLAQLDRRAVAEAPPAVAPEPPPARPRTRKSTPSPQEPAADPAFAWTSEPAPVSVPVPAAPVPWPVPSALDHEPAWTEPAPLSPAPIEPAWFDLPAEREMPLAPSPPRSEPTPRERPRPAFAPLSGAEARLPQVDLLDAPLLRQETVAPETLEMTSRLIEKKLKDFGVLVTVVAAMPGPVITRYEIEPATGVKGSQIVGLAKDLARSLSLISIRVVETIPGKNYMALELPNAKRQSIRLSEILGAPIYQEASSLLTMGLGKDIIGNPVVADLAKMPHVLVAGTTGSGKSVGINAMILSLLFKAEASEVRLLMIDPKMLEMSVYEGIPHLLAPVVTDMKQAANGLTWCVAEMERRYKLLSKMGVRNLAGYNARIDEAAAREEFIDNPFSLTPEAPEPLERLPHIVVVIDELADLMMVVGKKIEELIARLAQKARAAGIHLILATQRPSVDVITGLIKANIPTRIAFQVSSKIDSRTILDQMGAEALLGMGDMLYMLSGTGFPVRVHGAFVSDDEVHRVVKYLKSQGEPNYVEGLLEGGVVEGEDGAAGEGSEGGGEKDPMYDQAVEVVLKDRKASISYVQRKLRIGYNRSARLLEDMENAGLVSALTSSGQRDILVPARPE